MKALLHFREGSTNPEQRFKQIKHRILSRTDMMNGTGEGRVTFLHHCFYWVFFPVTMAPASIHIFLCTAWGERKVHFQFQYKNINKNDPPQFLKLFLGLFYHMNQMPDDRMQAKH